MCLLAAPQLGGSMDILILLRAAIEHGTETTDVAPIGGQAMRRLHRQLQIRISREGLALPYLKITARWRKHALRCLELETEDLF